MPTKTNHRRIAQWTFVILMAAGLIHILYTIFKHVSE